VSKNGNAYVWHRPKFIDELDELASFPACGKMVGHEGGTVSKWARQYKDKGFPEPVCTAGKHEGATKYLVKSEFADWYLQHTTDILSKDKAFLKRLQADVVRVRERITSKQDDVHRAKSLQEKWSKS